MCCLWKEYYLKTPVKLSLSSIKLVTKNVSYMFLSKITAIKLKSCFVSNDQTRNVYVHN